MLGVEGFQLVGGNACFTYDALRGAPNSRIRVLEQLTGRLQSIPEDILLQIESTSVQGVTRSSSTFNRRSSWTKFLDPRREDSLKPVFIFRIIFIK